MKIAKPLIIAVFVVLTAAMLLPAQAQNLLPKQITDIFGLLGAEGSGSAGFVQSRIQLGLVLALGAVVLVAVVYSILSALKYIQSQGDAGKIEEAQKAIKAIFFGIGAMLIAIVGIVLVFVFFGASRPDPSLFQTCLTSPNSIGCRACTDGETNNDDTCTACEDAFKAFAANPGSSPNPAEDQSLKVNCGEPIATP
jgi:hypothetical protein